MGGYFVLLIIGFIMLAVGLFTMKSRIIEFTFGSKKENLYEEWLHTRRVGGCIAFEGVFISTLTLFCLEKENPIPLYILLPISLVICGVLLYFFHKHKPMKK